MKHLLAFYPLYPRSSACWSPSVGATRVRLLDLHRPPPSRPRCSCTGWRGWTTPRTRRAPCSSCSSSPPATRCTFPHREPLPDALVREAPALRALAAVALAGLLGACAALTRINGVALGAALLRPGPRTPRRRRWRSDWLFLLLVPAGAVGYLLVNLLVTGDPFAFLRFQHEHFRRTLDWPWNGYLEMWRSLPAAGLQREPPCCAAGAAASAR